MGRLIPADDRRWKVPQDNKTTLPSEVEPVPTLKEIFTLVFYRLHSDRRKTPAGLENQFAGTDPSACWVIGGGPSLNAESAAVITASPAPKMCLNLAGTALLRPTFWTSYDPSVRFLKSVYLDPSILKFVKASRAMDLVPETNVKVCDCPNLVFFDGDAQRGFADFLSPEHRTIVDWNDTLVQAIDILYRLGFRTMYLAGCEMHVDPGPAWRAAAREAGVEFERGTPLQDFLRQCEPAGLARERIQSLGTGRQYHFDEEKEFSAVVNTDGHYFRIAQYLRLSRRSLSLAGVRLASVTPDSRLNDYFPFMPLQDAAAAIHAQVGEPQGESTRGLYCHSVSRFTSDWGPMRDYRPHPWKGTPPLERPANQQPPDDPGDDAAVEIRRDELKRYLNAPPDVPLREIG